MRDWKCDRFQKGVEILAVGLFGADDIFRRLQGLLIPPAHPVGEIFLILDPLQPLHQIPVLTDDVLGVQEVQLVVLQDLLQLVVHPVDLKYTRRPYRQDLNESWLAVSI